MPLDTTCNTEGHASRQFRNGAREVPPASDKPVGRTRSAARSRAGSRGRRVAGYPAGHHA